MYICRLLCRQDLLEQYNIVDPLVVERLLKAVRRAKEEDTDEDVSITTPGSCWWCTILNSLPIVLYPDGMKFVRLATSP